MYVTVLISGVWFGFSFEVSGFYIESESVQRMSKVTVDGLLAGERSSEILYVFLRVPPKWLS